MSKNLSACAVGTLAFTVAAVLTLAGPGIASGQHQTPTRVIGGSSANELGGSYSDLSGVTTISATDAWAVGVNGPGHKRHALIQHWDGTSWTSVVNAGGGHGKSYLAAVSAVGANDIWAVGRTGGGTQPLIEHGDGSSWTQVAAAEVPEGSSLAGVTAIAADDVWAVGAYVNSSHQSRTLVEHWDGTSWTQVPSPSPGPDGPHGSSLTGISAVAADDIWAVGRYEPDATSQYDTLTLHWDGTSWTQVSSPSPGGARRSELAAVSANSATDVWAVGDYDHTPQASSLVEHWDGSSWTKVASPNKGAYYNPLYGVTALSATDAWAVGASFDSSTSIPRPFNVHWNGVTWKRVPSSGPQGWFGSRLFGVAGSGGSDVWAVGAGSPQHFLDPLIQHWDGSSWTTL